MIELGDDGRLRSAISVLSYLKTAVVGLNNNSLSLTDDQAALRNSYYLMQKKDKMHKDGKHATTSKRKSTKRKR